VSFFQHTILFPTNFVLAFAFTHVYRFIMQVDFVKTFGPTVQDFIWSNKTITVLIAPLGEGKTFGCIAAMITHAKKAGVPIRCAIVRDTLENIKLSIVPSIQEFFREFFPYSSKFYRFKNEYKELTIKLPGVPVITVDLFGIDDPASLERLKGSSAYSLIWLNEPAPIADKANAGLSEDVYKVAVVRAVRYKGAKGRLIVDMNPADMEHWTYRAFKLEPDVDPEFPLIQKQVWHVPYGENKHLKEESRQAAKRMYKDDPANYARYVKGEFATIPLGTKVTPAYNRIRHLSEFLLEPAPGLESFAFFDAWGNPSCVLGQITKNNRLIFLDTLRLLGSDIETLLELLVIPMIESPRWRGKAKAWRVGGDRTMLNMDQSSRLETAAKKVLRAFPGCTFEGGPTTWAMIEQHLPKVLRASDERGEPLILLSSDNNLLDKALGGGWHYKVNNQGQRVSTLPEKDENSHVGDAWANAVCVLLPSRVSKLPRGRARQAAMRAKRRANSYAVGGIPVSGQQHSGF